MQTNIVSAALKSIIFAAVFQSLWGLRILAIAVAARPPGLTSPLRSSTLLSEIWLQTPAADPTGQYNGTRVQLERKVQTDRR